MKYGIKGYIYLSFGLHFVLRNHKGFYMNILQKIILLIIIYCVGFFIYEFVYLIKYLKKNSKQIYYALGYNQAMYDFKHRKKKEYEEIKKEYFKKQEIKQDIEYLSQLQDELLKEDI